MRIFVIDDNPDDRALAEHEVRALFPDAEVVEIFELARFEEALRTTQPDLVVTDLNLRWSDGRRIFTDTRAAAPHCPVIMFTGTGNETIAVDLMKAGLDDYVVKSPRQLSRLRASIRIAVDASRNRRDLSRREAQLAAALARQVTLVRELHHRVRNNLQIVQNLLLLRARRAEPAVAATLGELAEQVQALAAVQARIHESESLDRVDVRAVLDDVVGRLLEVTGGGRIAFVRQLDAPLDLDVSRAMPLGLLLYEIVLNAAKHAWPAGAQGALTVALTATEGGTEITISDDGVGFVAENIVPSLGSHLMPSLAAEASVELSSVSHPGDGTTVTLRLR